MTPSEEQQHPDEAKLRELERRLHARLRKVEEESRALRGRSRLLGLGLLTALALLAVMIVRPELASVIRDDVADVIEARRVVLVDPAGSPRGEWAIDESGNARLSMLDRERRPRLTLTVLQGGYPGLSLANAAGQRKVALGLLPDETTSLVFADHAGIPRAVLGLTTGEAASLVFADADGVSRMGMGLDGSGVGTVMFPDDSLVEEDDVPIPDPGG